MAIPGPSLAQAPALPLSLDARVVLGAYEALTEEHLQGVLNSLTAVATTADPNGVAWQQLRQPLGRLAAGLPTSAAVWFMRPDGTYFTVADDRVAGSLADRDYFPVLKRGRPVIGALVISRSTGARSIVVAAPITAASRVVGAVGVSLSATRLGKRLDDEFKLPGHCVFYALDTHGQTALHRDLDLVFQFPSDIGDATLKSAVQKMLSQPQGIVQYTFRGAHRTVVFHQSPLTGWVFALGIVE